MSEDPPALASLKVAAPDGLERVLQRCLAKDAEERWQSARDLKIELDWIAGAPREAARGTGRGAASRCRAMDSSGSAGDRRQRRIVGGMARDARDGASAGATPDIAINPPPGTHFLAFYGGSAISPDGRVVAFIASAGGLGKLWVRPLDSVSARELPGTEGAQYPFWSPDSHSIGYFADGKRKRVESRAAPSTILADAPISRGGTWNEEGLIVFAAYRSDRGF